MIKTFASYARVLLSRRSSAVPSSLLLLLVFGGWAAIIARPFRSPASPEGMHKQAATRDSSFFVRYGEKAAGPRPAPPRSVWPGVRREGKKRITHVMNVRAFKCLAFLVMS